MPISPKPFLLQMYEEVVSPKVPVGSFKDGVHFADKLRFLFLLTMTCSQINPPFKPTCIPGSA